MPIWVFLVDKTLASKLQRKPKLFHFGFFMLSTQIRNLSTTQLLMTR